MNYKVNFLIIHNNGIGDFLMFTPALKEILKKYPECLIDIFLTNKNVKKIVEGYPNINKIYVSSLNIMDILKNVKKLRRKKYDYLIVTTGGKTWKANIISFLLKAKIKVGEHIYFKSIFYTHSVKRYFFTHFVENNIRLIREIIDFSTTEEYNLWFPLKQENFNKNVNIKEEKNLIIGIHPGSQKAYKERRWPKFKELIKEILKNNKEVEIFVFLGEEDEELRNDFLGLKNIFLIEGKEINEVAYYISKCNLFINSDSGLGHLYTCFNNKIISIFGPNQLGLNQELRTGPYSKEAIIIKKRGMKEEYYKTVDKNGILKCLNEITVDEVIKKISLER